MAPEACLHEEGRLSQALGEGPHASAEHLAARRSLEFSMEPGASLFSPRGAGVVTPALSVQHQPGKHCAL